MIENDIFFSDPQMLLVVEQKNGGKADPKMAPNIFFWGGNGFNSTSFVCLFVICTCLCALGADRKEYSSRVNTSTANHLKFLMCAELFLFLFL